MWPPCPQPPAPLQESPERGVGVGHDGALVLLCPHFQAGQRHVNVQSPENLWSGQDGPEAGGRHMCWHPALSPPFSLISKPAPVVETPIMPIFPPTAPNLVHIVGDLQETLFGVVQVLVLGQELEKQQYGGVTGCAGPTGPPQPPGVSSHHSVVSH